MIYRIIVTPGAPTPAHHKHMRLDRVHEKALALKIQLLQRRGYTIERVERVL